jgi:putative transposase
VLLRGHNGQPVFGDAADRDAFLSALSGACEDYGLALHAWALRADCVWLLCRPTEAQSLSRAMQVLGRRYAAAFNRRHHRRGSLWDGRFRAAAVEPGQQTLNAMVFVDQGGGPRTEGEPATGIFSSARQHSGLELRLGLVDAPEYWALGNTPFDRAIAYRAILEEQVSEKEMQRLTSSVERGWPIGTAEFLQALQTESKHAVMPRARGRPRRHAPSPAAGR